MTAADTAKPLDDTGEPIDAPTPGRRSSSEGRLHTMAPRSIVKARFEQVVLTLMIVVPLTALAAAVPVLWGRWITWRDVVIGAVMYAVAGHGVTVGFHRYFTHRGFKTSRPVRIMLALAGQLAIEGPVIRWVADHRRHHAFSDRDGDPHSPWRYGTSFLAVAKGLVHAHVGWLFDIEQTDQRRYAPDLLDDRDIRIVSRLFALCAFVSLTLPPVIGGLWGGSFAAAVQAFFWASLVRVGLLHHVTWSTNSICHVFGARPYKSRDMSGNVWPLAFLSMGESWHNLHHADPTLARHGVEPWQLDTSAYLIRLMETLRLVRDVRWPDRERLKAKLATTA